MYQTLSLKQPIAPMVLGTQWYILFNVIAGAMSIPSDLKEAASLYRFTRWQRWTTLILPGIFPYLITGMVTASGGAWNASVWGRVRLHPEPNPGNAWPGSANPSATTNGQFPILLLATIMIFLMVGYHESTCLAAPLPACRNPV